MPRTRITTEYLTDEGARDLRYVEDFDQEMEWFAPPPPATAIRESRRLRAELDALIDEVEPLLGRRQWIALSDAVNNFDSAVRQEFVSRLLALAIDAVDNDPRPAARLRPTLITLPWATQQEDPRDDA